MQMNADIFYGYIIKGDLLRAMDHLQNCNDSTPAILPPTRIFPLLRWNIVPNWLNSFTPPSAIFWRNFPTRLTPSIPPTDMASQTITYASNTPLFLGILIMLLYQSRRFKASQMPFLSKSI